MGKREVLKLCVDSGFFLDRGMLDFFVNLDIKEVELIIGKLKNLGVIEGILSLDVFRRYKDRLGVEDKGLEIRNSGIKVLRDIKVRSGKITSEDFMGYFRSRFENLRDILIGKGLGDLISIRRIGFGNGVYVVIGMVYSKRITKNRNLLIEVEDLTGRGIVLVNRENKQLFERAQNLLLDDVVAFKCSGSSKMLFANDFIYPDSELKVEKFGDSDEFVAFVSDLHIGSKNFLEGNLMRFVDWVNGEVGDDRQKGIASKVKYLILAGDNIDGVGVYPDQERFLAIKGCRKQYDKLGEILGRIRKDVEIIMCPGLHDAVWVGEPMPALSRKWVQGLKNMTNLRLVSNPATVNIGGLDIMIYSGGSFNQFENFIIGNGNIIEEILKRRHLAPVYGEMDVVPNKEGDDLVIGDLPDVFFVGGRHKAEVKVYNNILTISGSCFQSRTDFEAKVGAEVDPCKVSILNLKSREVKILDFSSGEVVWEKGDGLSCEIGGRK
ncbi:MAG: hypothetical protein V1888_02455 [archaeon]